MKLQHIALIAVFGVFLSGCSLLPAKDAQLEAPADMPEAAVEANPAESMMQDETSQEAEGTSVAIVANDFTFDVTEIKVKQGEKLTLSVMNEKGFHDLVIDELDVNSGMIKAGDTIELEIPTDKPGTYEYYCSVGQHREMGMKGTLIIE